jgi:hypothetical protein
MMDYVLFVTVPVKDSMTDLLATHVTEKELKKNTVIVAEDKRDLKRKCSDAKRIEKIIRSKRFSRRTVKRTVWKSS